MFKKPAPQTCPVCGEDVPRKALACPECGADHNSGWREDAGIYDGMDLPDENFDYDEFVQKELQPAVRPDFHLGWWITGILLALAFLAMLLSR